MVVDKMKISLQKKKNNRLFSVYKWCVVILTIVVYVISLKWLVEEWAVK